MMASMVLDGPINRDAFQAYIDQVLVPELKPADVIITNNFSSHRGAKVRQAIQAVGNSALPAALQSRLQPYSSWELFINSSNYTLYGAVPALPSAFTHL
jgi:hypothetical protein